MKVREPLRVESDWIQCHDITYRSLADAVMDVGPAPCTRYECDRIAECKRDKVECFAFRISLKLGVRGLREDDHNSEQNSSNDQDPDRFRS